jgi:hypothetical protein
MKSADYGILVSEAWPAAPYTICTCCSPSSVKLVSNTGWRDRKPFVVLNCAALPDTLIESGFFGVERAWPEAVDSRGG